MRAFRIFKRGCFYEDVNGDGDKIKYKIIYIFYLLVSLKEASLFYEQGHRYKGYKGPGGRCVALPRHQPLQGVFEGPEDSSSSYAAASIAHAYHGDVYVGTYARTHARRHACYPIGLTRSRENCFALRTTARTSVIGKA